MKKKIILTMLLSISGVAYSYATQNHRVSYQVFEDNKLLVSPKLIVQLEEEAIFEHGAIEDKVIEIITTVSKIEADNEHYHMSSRFKLNGVNTVAIDQTIALGSEFSFDGGKYRIDAKFE
ncbi:hypothetical protein QF117_05225 [Vibrio sp. YMD68]|uniref:hypothetical protein n=1 Tax=Vibrio sp. YMD68 TaxID=3042300 RepID=UPI00249AD54F|nr:hypothetical protein [Vibrio sp. YMD68]WGV98260.1 hypothetical protein QF117_05225 [Vibrio sp. YMD68]